MFLFYYPITARKRSLGKGNVVTRVCHSVHGREGAIISRRCCPSQGLTSLAGGAVGGGGDSAKEVQ